MKGCDSVICFSQLSEWHSISQQKPGCWWKCVIPFAGGTSWGISDHASSTRKLWASQHFVWVSKCHLFQPLHSFRLWQWCLGQLRKWKVSSSAITTASFQWNIWSWKIDFHIYLRIQCPKTGRQSKRLSWVCYYIEIKPTSQFNSV